MKRVVILGGGFGGLRCAMTLGPKLKGKAQVCLIDRQSYHSYTPSLYEVATAFRGTALVRTSLNEEHFKEMIGSVIAFPFSDTLPKRNVSFIHSAIRSIDAVSKYVVLQDGTKEPFDYLIIGLGSQTNYFGVEGADKYCLPIKTVGDALRIRDRVLSVFAQSKKTRAPVTIAVVGAGLAGFEVATEMVMFVQHLKDRHSLHDIPVKIVLIEAMERVLSACSSAFCVASEKRLSALGVSVMVNKRIVKVQNGALFFGDGSSLKTDVQIWSAGIQGSPVLKDSKGLPVLTKRGQLSVSPFLSLPEHDHIFVVGDCVDWQDKESDIVVPQTAWAAEQEASIVAYNVVASLCNAEKKAYVPHIVGMVASAGGKYAIAEIRGFLLTGFFAWALKRMIDLKYLLSLYKPHTAFIIWIKGVRLFGRND